MASIYFENAFRWKGAVGFYCCVHDCSLGRLSYFEFCYVSKTVKFFSVSFTFKQGVLFTKGEEMFSPFDDLFGYVLLINMLYDTIKYMVN